MKMHPALLAAATIAVGPLLSPPAGSAEPTKCKLVSVGEIPVRIHGNLLVADGSINGKPVGILLDTGAEMTIVLRPSAERLGLNRETSARYRMTGVGGESVVETAIVEEFRIGKATLKGRRMLVAGDRGFGGDVAVILGADFFHQVDVELDIGQKMVRLFQPKDCETASLAYWAPGGAGIVDLEPVSDVSPRMFVPVTLNDQPVRALLDTGANFSVVDRARAINLGLATGESGVAAGTAGGIGEARVEIRAIPLKRFVIGDEVVKDTTITVANLARGRGFHFTGSRLAETHSAPFDMILGTDFLRAHRVYVAHSQRKLYFTYTGGPVFQRALPAADKGSAPPAPAGSP